MSSFLDILLCIFVGAVLIILITAVIYGLIAGFNALYSYLFRITPNKVKENLNNAITYGIPIILFIIMFDVCAYIFGCYILHPSSLY